MSDSEHDFDEESPLPVAHEKNDKSRIQVFVRVRPMLQGETADETNVTVESTEVVIKKQFDVKRFAFDKVFDVNASQNDVFSSVAQETIEVCF